jgi:Tfp pilus assembly PilM family ATPase
LARVVGLDIGARHVRLVEADGGARGMRVRRLGEREIAPPVEGADREQAVRDAVEALFAETRAGKGDVVLSWPAEQCILRELTVPFQKDDDIRKVVKFEFESHLHSHAIEDVVVDFVRTGSSPEGSRLLGIAAPKAPLRARLKALAGARIEPVAVDLDAAALVEAAAAAGVLAETPHCVLVDIGARATRVVLVVDGTLRTCRTVRGGTEALAAAAARDTGDPAAAVRALEGGARADDLLALPRTDRDGPEFPARELSAVGLAAGVIEDRRSEFLDRLGRETARTLAGAPQDVVFAAAWLSGRGSTVPGVAGRIEERLGIPAKPLDLFPRIESPVPPDRAVEESAVYAVALGAAARALRMGPLQVDLRREDLAFAKRYDQVKGLVASLLFLLVVAVTMVAWRTKLEKDAWYADFLAMKGRLEEKRPKVEEKFEADKDLKEIATGRLPKPSDDPLAVVADAERRARKMKEVLRNELGINTDVPPIVSSLELFRMVNAAVRSVRDKLQYCLMQNETYDQKEAKFTIVVSEVEHADLLKGAFDAVKDADGKVVFKAEYGTLKQDKDGRWPATFTLTLAKAEKPE